jgi:toxin FitB
MNGFLLDTNVPSETVRLYPEKKVEAWFASRDKKELYLSAVSCGELRKGIDSLKQSRRKNDLELWYNEVFIPKFEQRILPFTKSTAELWGALEAQRNLVGRPMQVADAQIAATALEHGLYLVTRNIKDFEGLGLTLINPWE